MKHLHFYSALNNKFNYNPKIINVLHAQDLDAINDFSFIARLCFIRE